MVGFDVYMMTPDKDFAQLVDEHIFHYKPARPPKGVEILGIEETLRKWEIRRIDQVIDILGLMGDKVDNIPGIPGIGEKTAKDLLSHFKSIKKINEASKAQIAEIIGQAKAQLVFKYFNPESSHEVD